MPILDIEIVASDSTDSLPVELTQSLADAVAQVFGAPQGTVWVKLQIIPPTQYAEDGGTPIGVHPVFVRVLKSRVPEGGALEDEITQLTKVVASILNRHDTNIHIFYQPDGTGRVAFGGNLVK